MQYFPASHIRVLRKKARGKSELLFYLVTEVFAQWLCGRRLGNFAVQSGSGSERWSFQLLRYSEHPLQVPYNQRL